MNQRDLEKTCLKWQQRLRLMDWNIEAKFVSRHELLGRDIFGEIDFQIHHKQALLKVLLDREGYPFMDKAACSVDHVVVHELLHLHMIDWKDEDNETAQEQAINLIAYALVEGWEGKEEK